MLTNPEVTGEQTPTFQHRIFKDRKDGGYRMVSLLAPEQKRIRVRLRRFFATTLTQRPVTLCHFGAVQGRRFCEIMGSKYCHECIREKRKKDIEEEKS